MSRLKSLYLIAIILFLALLFSGSVERENYVSNNEIIWSDDHISWENFTKVEEKEENYVASIYSEIYCPDKISWFDSEVYAYMDPDLSEKLADSMLDDQVLIHERYHFNITEYHARILRKSIVEIGENKLTDKVLDSLYRKYELDRDLMQIEYDSITNHNVNTQEQRYWEMKIDDLLRQTDYYQNTDIYGYWDYDKGETEYFRKIFITFDKEVLSSFPVYEEQINHGESYKIVKKRNKTTVSFLKDGTLKNGGVFKTAITTIEKKKGLIEIKYFNNDYTLNEDLDYCIFKRYINNDKRVDHYYSSNEERVNADKIYQTQTIVDSNGCMVTSYYNFSLKKIKNKYGVYHKKRTLDTLGRTTVLEFFDLNNRPINDTDLESKIIREYDSSNQTTSYKEYDQNGDFAKHLFSYNLKYEYDERGNLKKSINLDHNDEIAPNKDGVSIYTYTYDQNDNLTSTRRFNKQNEPILGKDDYHMEVEVFDNKARTLFYGKYYPGYVLAFNEEKWGGSKYSYPNDSIVYVSNVNAYNHVFNDNTGVAILKRHINDKDRVEKLIYLDSDKNYAKTEDDIVEFRYKYDERGNQREEMTLDSLGNLKAFDADVAIVKWDYDANNNKIKTTYYNAASELANANQNVTYNVYKYDDKNQLVERTNFNRNMEPQLLDGYFKSEMIPTVFGSDSIVLSYDTNNKLIDGVCKIVYGYNRFNNNTSETFYNKENELTVNDLGVSVIKYSYDHRQLYNGFGYFDKNGNRTNGNNGISYNLQKFNDFGYVILDSYFDKNERSVIGPYGYHKKEYEWSEKGEILKINYYGINNKLLEDEYGVAEYRYTRGDSGLIGVIKRYNKYGKPTNNTSGVSETHYLPSLNGLYYLDKELDYRGNEISKDSIE